MIKIRATIDHKNGEMDVRVVDNPNGEGCDHNLNEKLLKDLLEAEVPGFGEIEILDSGLTEEGFEQRMKNRTKPLPFSPLKDPNAPQAPTPGTFKPQQPQEGQLDTGFGV